MKNHLSSLFLVFASFNCFAQDVKLDKIVKVNNETLSVKVVTVGEQSISFTYPNETVINTLSRNQIKEIDFASGRVQTITERIIIEGEQDWQKVIVTTLESDVSGLVRKGEVKAKATGGSTFSNQANIDARATEKLKKQAAKLGAHIILIQSQNTQRASFGNVGQMGQGPTSLKQGVAYGYQ
ncbi:hypothetical protein A0257_19060 [Hymenobacter psoromatis]|nr:hypothetical protein A0257_19060 [Hymenobacter psoromatis]